MRLALTGGGTGGHVFPALEVGLAARAEGWEVRYYGSQRGMEGEACAKEGLWFRGYASGPVFGVFTPKGIKALYRLYLASRQAMKDLSEYRPDAVFSTGGYSSAPVVKAAEKLGIPFVIHEQNSVPGRTNRILSRRAQAVCTVFEGAERQFPGARVIRTGMPIRRTLREGSQGDLPFHEGVHDCRKVILVMGGSQGAASLNDVALAAAVRMAGQPVRWIHLTGVRHFEAAMSARRKLPIEGDYDIHAFLDGEGMRWALGAASLAVCRSGAGTVSELAAFRIPAVFVPFPAAHGDHQARNAEEIASLGAADVVRQEKLEPVALEGRILSWALDEGRTASAQRGLASWDIVDSVPRIMKELQAAAGKGR